MGVVGFRGRRVLEAKGMWIIDINFCRSRPIHYGVYVGLMYPKDWCRPLGSIYGALVRETEGRHQALNPISLPCHMAHKWTCIGDSKVRTTSAQSYNSNILSDFPDGLCGYGADEHIPIIP